MTDRLRVIAARLVLVRRERRTYNNPLTPLASVKRRSRNALASLLVALLLCVDLAVVASAQPLDTYTCFTCYPEADQFRKGDYSALEEPIIDPSCECPFPNNFIPASRLLENGAWPQDIYLENRRAFRGLVGRVALGVAQGSTPAQEALQYGSRRHPRRHLHPEELERLLEELSQAEIDAQLVRFRYRSGRTPLHKAAWWMGSAIIRLLIDNGAIVDSRDRSGRTPLMWARSLEAFRTLQAAGADIRARSDTGYTVLHHAASVTDADTVEALIASGLDPNVRMDSGLSPLHYARSPEIFEVLRKAGANVHAHAPGGSTVLHQAAESFDAASVEALIGSGLDPNAETRIGVTPLMLAGSREIFDALLAGGADLAPIEAVFAPGGLEAVLRGHIDTAVLRFVVNLVGRVASAPLVARLRAVNPRFAELSGSVSVNSRYFPLHQAVTRNEDPAMIAALSTPNVTATTRSAFGLPLSLAARSNANPDVIEVLLAAGASVHVNRRHLGNRGRPPLYDAALNPNPRAGEIVDVLLRAGAYVNGWDEYGEDTGYVPLYAAAMIQNLDVIERLLAAGADVNVTGSSKYQSLLADVLGRGRFDCGYAPVASALQAAGAESWRVVGEQRMPYVPGPPVVECDTVSPAVQELIDSGADLDARDSQGFTALHRAAAAGKAADVTALSGAGADVNAMTRDGRLTPVHVAIWRRAGLVTVRALIAAGADVDAADWLGSTALHRAARDSRTAPGVVQALLEAGADANARDSLWRTPLDYATRADVNNEPVADLLRKGGGVCHYCVGP